MNKMRVYLSRYFCFLIFPFSLRLCGCSTVPDEQQRDSETDSSVKKGKEIAATKKKTRPSLNSLAILKEAGQSINTSSLDNLCDQLHAGVFLKPNKLKYFVDKVSNKNCFELFARELNILGSDERPEYWQWNQDKDISGEDIEVAQLLHLSWLEVRGTIWTVDLSPETLYEIVFVVKIIGGNISEFSMKLTMTYPNNESKKHHESLEEKPFDKWFELWVGDFIMSPEIVGYLNFTLDATDQMYKDGLVVKSAIIRPKN